MSKFDSHAWQKAFKNYSILSEKDKDKVTLKDLLHTIKVDDKKADKVDVKIGAENDLAIEKDKKGEDVYAKGLTEAPIQRAKVDYSTIDLKSNIAQKWLSFQDMMEDLNQWLSVALDGVPDAEITRVGKDLRDLGIEMTRRQQVHGTTTRR